MRWVRAVEKIVLVVAIIAIVCTVVSYAGDVCRLIGRKACPGVVANTRALRYYTMEAARLDQAAESGTAVHMSSLGRLTYAIGSARFERQLVSCEGGWTGRDYPAVRLTYSTSGGGRLSKIYKADVGRDWMVSLETDEDAELASQ